jgi:outer membrane protein OmpU
LFSVSALVADSDNQADTAYGISGKFDLGESTEIRAIFNDTGVDGLSEQYGVGFRHGLGGGVTLAGGVGRNGLKDTVADLGVQFNF